MIFFGHIGITTAIIKKYEKIDDTINIDYRYVFVGSILPDLIDKPINMLLHHGFILEGRLIGHTLLFAIFLLFLGSMNLMQKNNGNIFILGLCSLIHIVLDGIWLCPQVLFFPLFGVDSILNFHMVKIPILTTLFSSNFYRFLGEILGVFFLVYYKHNKTKKSNKEKGFFYSEF
jgi:hypothetical protein